MSVLLEARPYRPFKSSEEYLIAMKEDLAEWLNALYPELRISLDNFMDRLDTGVALCKHANGVRKSASDYVARRQARKIMTRSITSSLAMPMSQLSDVAFLPNAKAGTFFARDNVSNFITWCRNSLGIIECLLFETDDLIMRKNERHVILCLLEVARRGAKFGMLAPMLVQMERQIDREIAADNRANNATCNLGVNGNGHNGHDDDDDEDADDEDEYADVSRQEPCLIYGPQPQIVTNDLKSLDEMVRDLVERCTCPTQFPMIRVSEGKYRIGDTKVLIFVRILRSHVMVRVGGGWDTLSHYLDKHDPCRCRTSHRSMISAKLIQKAGGSFDLGSAQVHYERSPPRTRRSSASSVGSCTGLAQQQQQQQPLSQQQQQQQQSSPSHQLQMPRSVSAMGNRSRSPTPHRTHNRQLLVGQELKKTSNRSPSPTPRTKRVSCSPVRRQVSDLGNSRRSRSPTQKIHHPRFNDSEEESGNVDKTRKALNEEIRRIRYDGRSQMYHSRHLDDYQDPKHDLHREIREKVPLSEDFAKRYVVEGGVARRVSERDDAPKYEPTIYGYKCGGGPESSSSSSPIPSPTAVKEDQQQRTQRNIAPSEDPFAKDSSQQLQYVKSSHAEAEHSDNGSEVSDEGYRSLGAVQPTIASTITINNQHQQDTSMVLPESHEEAAEERKNKVTDVTRSCVETDSIETGLRKTRAIEASPTESSSPVGSSVGARSGTGSGTDSPSATSCCIDTIDNYGGERSPRGSSMARENSNLSRCSSGSRTPRDGNSSPEICGSPLKRGVTNGRNSLKKPPAPPTSSPGKSYGMSRCSGLAHSGDNGHRTRNESMGGVTRATKNSGTSNTWNGRQARQRPSLSNDTFVKPTTHVNVRTTSNLVKSSSPTNFSRKNPTRQSLPRLASLVTNGNSATAASPPTSAPQYDRNGRKIKSCASTSLQTSPTKIANPLLERILSKMSHLRDDKEVVEKLQVLIRDYQGQVALDDDGGDEKTASTMTTNDDASDPTLEFTRAWLDGNGTVALSQNDAQSIASPRKDPKPPSERGSGFSRIPAPIYKRPMSVASDSL